jgi:hypothetical protein
MICTLTARRLAPGSHDQFREIWEGEEKAHPEIASRWNPVYVTRSVEDDNVVLTFGFFDGSLEELREAQQQYRYSDVVDRLAPHVEEVLFDGAFEVIEERRR